MALLHVRHDFLAEEQLTHSLLCPALSDFVIGHGDEITRRRRSRGEEAYSAAVPAASDTISPTFTAPLERRE